MRNMLGSMLQWDRTYARAVGGAREYKVEV